MKVASRVGVTAGGMLAVLDTRPPLTVRRVRHPDRDCCALCLVGTAAGPLAGDDLTLALDVGAGARATLVAAGASLAQGRSGGTPAAVRLLARVGAGADLDADPGPLVVAEGAHVEVSVELDLAIDATLRWQETVVLGRQGGSGGQVRLRWDVRRGGVPLLRQDVDLADVSLAGWPGMVAGHRVLSSTLRVGPAVDARTVVLTPTAVTQRLADGAALTTVLAADTVIAAQQTGQLAR